ncbi:MAG: 23S rRNA (guanosine(2251)-2'-O)-methyltransferase RlmB [Candidatus Marinimicrobia bacterium]|nr:23S rRNA (guanosine(2251)-2'-O)-methyltransferase RlmB [Candidatus Neomarinimicrobiota bacterium]MBL7023084.1 23S rRNA (guanosine(2251)-2'-O)-methyltransferase RlmB [Candidatus Neomarinimicrobiota bacterium]MBL7109104.1 23S rRNA (guanosine(2251)-2'-O)-methyltransferase RlmB [Candidatus Neomarinimicrobiota bacterium]
MRQKSKYKNKKSTESFGFMIYGLNGVTEILKTKRFSIHSIHLQKDSKAIIEKRIQSSIKLHQGKVQVLDKETFLKKYKGLRTQGVVVHFDGKVVQNVPSFKNAKGNICILIADNIEDPQNLGQIMRTAECAGIEGIAIPEHHSAGITNTVLQVSQGAFIHLPIFKVVNIRNLMKQLKDDGFWIVGLENSISAKQWHQIDYSGKIAIVVGSEGKGIRKAVLKDCDFLATIPMKGKINSLNVSASVSAILFERQRQVK